MMTRPFVLAAAILALATAGAAAQGCVRGNQIGSSYGSNGINAIAPSRAVQNRCSTMYGFGTHRHRYRHHRRGTVR